MLKTNKKNKTRFSLEVLTLYFFALIILVLSIINIKSYFVARKPNVLGTNTYNSEGVFWYEFLKENPNYIPGWVEIGRTDKVKAINPNYL